MFPYANKSFGQNWLVDESVVQKIIEAAQIQPGEAVLEIGPGTGILTQALVDAGAQVTAIEADKTLIPALQERFGTSIELIQGDVLSHSYNLPPTTYKLVANIPYNITSDILRQFLTQEPKPTQMVLMVQKEVADRITAHPPDMSLLSVMCQLYAKCRRVVKVPAGAFRPSPKVDSAVVQLELFHTPHTKVDPETVISLAKVGFSARRKQLHKNLCALPGVESEQVKQALLALNLPAQARAQELTVEQWVTLTHIFGKKD